ncbi:MAG: ATP-binding protein [Desulfovibrio sp.]|jgi:hypothetical protein|nr:ATP-binding protein [Desulfovibrio sp.]
MAQTIDYETIPVYTGVPPAGEAVKAKTSAQKPDRTAKAAQTPVSPPSSQASASAPVQTKPTTPPPSAPPVSDPDKGKPNPFSLQSVVSSKARTMPPQKIVIYGTPGIGKTTFAGTFPDPILVRFEDGAAALDIPTFPQLVTGVTQLNMIFAALKGQHSYKSVIFDSLDWLEPLTWAYLCDKEKVDNIESFGYGKGYIKLDEVWRQIQSKLECLRTQRGMNVIVIAHAAAVTVDLPDSEAYQRYSMKLHKRAAALWMEWADMILFTNYETHIQKDEKKKMAKAKGIGTGNRVIFTQERPAYQAKCRWPLDEKIHIGNDPTWSAFHNNLNEIMEGLNNGV